MSIERAILRGFKRPPVFLRVASWGIVGVFTRRGGYRVSSWEFAPGKGATRRLVRRQEHGGAQKLELAKAQARGVTRQARTNPKRPRRNAPAADFGPLFAYAPPAAPAGRSGRPAKAPKAPKACTPPVVVKGHERGCPKPAKAARPADASRTNPGRASTPPKPPKAPAHLVHAATQAHRDWTGHTPRVAVKGRDPAVDAAPGGVLVDLGELVAVEYRQRKRPDGPAVGTYRHEFGEEGGRRPRLTADARARLRIVGGTYYIRPEGIRD